ncbi:MAG: tRNA pseudouridine(55) synthase TruB [Proteobacteria bacterium]|nr:tRNA pseudouridine(55) synthase TruB [Pseudomonadota bacterium]
MNPAVKKQKNNVSGWVVLDKPAGWSSTQAVGKVRWCFNAEKAGHGGTLDPFATGVLPIALGEATKLMPYVLEGDKSYRFTIRWGEARDSDDLTGKIIQNSDKRPRVEEIISAVSKFVGEISQIPPQFSALHVDGERAYDLARQGKEVLLQPRQVRIDHFNYIHSPSVDEAEFEVDCGKGTYIRALARDLGKVLGCFGHVSALKRVKSGPFTMENAISTEKLVEKAEEFRQKGACLKEFQAFVMPLAAALDDIPAVIVSEHEARKLRQGQGIPLHPLRIIEPMRTAKMVVAKDALGLVALTQLKWEGLQPVRVFNVQI